MTTKKFTPTITRGPRLTPGEISLTPPDDLGIDIPPSGVQKILPYVMGGAMLGMIAIMVAGGTRQLSPYMLMMPLMMIVMPTPTSMRPPESVSVTSRRWIDY